MYLASGKQWGKDVPVLPCSLAAAPRSTWAVPESLGWSWQLPRPSSPSQWTWPPMCTSSQSDHRSPGKTACTTSRYLRGKRNRWSIILAKSFLKEVLKRNAMRRSSWGIWSLLYTFLGTDFRIERVEIHTELQTVIKTSNIGLMN